MLDSRDESLTHPLRNKALSIRQCNPAAIPDHYQRHPFPSDPLEYPVPDPARDRACHARRPPARGHVIIGDGTRRHRSPATGPRPAGRSPSGSQARPAPAPRSPHRPGRPGESTSPRQLPRHPRLRADHPRLVVRPDPPRPPSRHQPPRWCPPPRGSRLRGASGRHRAIAGQARRAAGARLRKARAERCDNPRDTATTRLHADCVPPDSHGTHGAGRVGRAPTDTGREPT